MRIRVNNHGFFQPIERFLGQFFTLYRNYALQNMNRGFPLVLRGPSADGGANAISGRLLLQVILQRLKAGFSWNRWPKV